MSVAAVAVTLWSCRSLGGGVWWFDRRAIPIVSPTLINPTLVTSDSIMSSHPASGSSRLLYGGTLMITSTAASSATPMIRIVRQRFVTLNPPVRGRAAFHAERGSNTGLSRIVRRRQLSVRRRSMPVIRPCRLLGSLDNSFRWALIRSARTTTAPPPSRSPVSLPGEAERFCGCVKVECSRLRAEGSRIWRCPAD